MAVTDRIYQVTSDPRDPNNGVGLAGDVGTIVLASDTNQLFIKWGSHPTEWRPMTAEQGAPLGVALNLGVNNNWKPGTQAILNAFPSYVVATVGASSITGIGDGAQALGQRVTIISDAAGGGPLTIKKEDAGSTAENRIRIPADAVLGDGEAIELVYAAFATGNRWTRAS